MMIVKETKMQVFKEYGWYKWWAHLTLSHELRVL